ncbi:hypothetical protein L6R52_21875 [Myxococcota bacterium]|nr:hypothetical protein [Myxococcota bacterium]
MRSDVSSGSSVHDIGAAVDSEIFTPVHASPLFCATSARSCRLASVPSRESRHWYAGAQRAPGTKYSSASVAEPIGASPCTRRARTLFVISHGFATRARSAASSFRSSTAASSTSRSRSASITRASARRFFVASSTKSSSAMRAPIGDAGGGRPSSPSGRAGTWISDSCRISWEIAMKRRR